MIPRQLEKTIKNNQKRGFINIIYGPRRVGKTVLLKKLTSNVPKPSFLYFNGDTEETRNILSSTSEVKLSDLVKNAKTIAVDEAQRIPNIGLSLKILIDKFPQKTFYVTGSSSLALSKGFKESLTGRSIKYKLYPLSTIELTNNLENHKKISILENQLIFGGYPYLTKIAKNKEKTDYLKSVVDDYLFRDVNLLKEISSPDTLKKLATLLAFQIGSIVSLNELSRNLGIDVKTVGSYISLLKQSFVIFELSSFSKNPRKELAKSKKYYFWDLGIRNALTDQFLSLDARADVGLLWENFCAIERMKKHEYAKVGRKYYFWRSYEKAEIDWVETYGNELSAFEFKWSKAKEHTPKAFKETYGEEVKNITKDNYLEFVK